MMKGAQLPYLRIYPTNAVLRQRTPALFKHQGTKAQRLGACVYGVMGLSPTLRVIDNLPQTAPIDYMHQVRTPDVSVFGKVSVTI